MSKLAINFLVGIIYVALILQIFELFYFFIFVETARVLGYLFTIS